MDPSDLYWTGEGPIDSALPGSHAAASAGRPAASLLPSSIPGVSKDAFDRFIGVGERFLKLKLRLRHVDLLERPPACEMTAAEDGDAAAAAAAFGAPALADFIDVFCSPHDAPHGMVLPPGFGPGALV